MAAFGLSPELLHSSDDIFEVWPENEEIVRMFLRIGTQWRTSFGGLVGLDYTVLFNLFDLYGIKDRREMFEGIQVMESAALEAVKEESDG
jgi:hypothetical protein